MDRKEYFLDLFERYITNKASFFEVEELRQFIHEDMGLNRWMEEQIMQSSNEITIEIKQRMLENIRQNISPSFSSQQPQTNKNIYLKITSIAAIVFFVLLSVSINYMLNNKSKEISSLIVRAESGEKANMILSDGTKVWLNSASKLTYYSNFNEKTRTLDLDGEAYFEVASNPNIPFIVNSLDTKVEVLGTNFGIKSYSEDSVVSVILNSGRVKVNTPNEEFFLNPDEKIAYNKNSHRVAIEKVNSLDFSEWRYNSLRFENESLGEIATTLTRVYNIEILFDSDDIKTRKFTGTVDNTNIHRALDAITITSTISYKIKDGRIILFEAK